MSDSQLDVALRAYRESPTPENYERLIAIQRAQATSFMRTQSDEFIARTMDRGKNK